MTSPLPEALGSETSKRTRRWTWLFLAGVLLSSSWWLTCEIAIWRAFVCLEAREHSAALSWLTLASRLRSGSAETHYLLARTHRRLRQFEAVTRHLERSLALGYSSRLLEREQWLAQAQTGQFAAMKSHWSDLFANAGSDGPEISKAFVTGTLAQLRLRDATKVLDAWQADFPDDPDQYFLRGQLAFVQLDHAAAAIQFRQTIQRQSSHDEARFLLATCLMNIGEIAEAAAQLERVLQRQPDHVDAEVALASCFAKLDRLDEARQRLQTVMKHSPKHVGALLEFGNLELAAKHSVEALPVLRRAAELKPEDREVIYSLAKALQATGANEEAHQKFAFVDEATKALLRLKILSNRLLKEPDNLDLRFEIAQITWSYQSRAEGAKWWLSLLEIEPRHVATHQALAEHFRRTNDLERAARHEAQSRRTEHEE